MSGSDEFPVETLRFGMTIDNARSMLSGYHFSQEALDPTSRGILHLAEAVLGEVDRLYGGYAKVLLTDDEADQVAAFVRALLRARRSSTGVSKLAAHMSALQVDDSVIVIDRRFEWSCSGTVWAVDASTVTVVYNGTEGVFRKTDGGCDANTCRITTEEIEGDAERVSQLALQITSATDDLTSSVTGGIDPSQLAAIEAAMTSTVATLRATTTD